MLLSLVAYPAAFLPPLLPLFSCLLFSLAPTQQAAFLPSIALTSRSELLLVTALFLISV